MSKITTQSLALFDFAYKQYGFFSSLQAQAFGYDKRKFTYHVKHGNWLKMDRGLYRLPNFDDTLESLFTRWSLWSRNKIDQPQGVISYYSALMYYGVLDLDIDKPVHLTVPKDFRKSKIPDSEIVIHKENLPLSDLENHGAFITTKLFKTLLDTKKELELQGSWMGVADKVAKSGKLTEEELLELGIVTTERKVMDSSGNYLGGKLYLGDSEHLQNDEIYCRTKDAQKIFESMERQGRWAMRASMYRNRKSQQGGFTLVELLVVIAVISILAGMLLPALQHAQEAAYSIVCINNIKQVSSAMGMYIDDNEGYAMSNADRQNWLFGPNNSTHYKYTLCSYLSYGPFDSSEVYGASTPPAPESICPKGGRDGTDNSRTSNTLPNYSYTFNTFLSPTSTTDYRYQKAISAKTPSKRLFFAECNSNSLWNSNGIQIRHNEFANISFLDQHVESWSDYEILNIQPISNGGWNGFWFDD
jgi:prepilin-type N-terminal cleavage/methylation domain-containing protein